MSTRENIRLIARAPLRDPYLTYPTPTRVDQQHAGG